MISKEEVQVVIDDLQVRPTNNSVMVLIPIQSEVTAAGVIKGDKAMQNEKTEEFLYVVAVSRDDTSGVETGERIYFQGEVIVFADDLRPTELDINLKGYQLGFLPSPYIKMIL